MRLKCVRAFAVLILACVCSVGLAIAAPPDRLRGAIDNNHVVVLKGSIHMLARPEFERGLVDPAQRISGVSLDLQPTAEQQAALDTFLEGQRDPGSADFQRWLTPEEFGDGFGVNEADLAQVTSWITAQGLTVEHVGEARNWIMFGGTAEQLGRAFHTSLRYYEVNGETHFGNDTEPSVPAAFGGMVRSIRCLDDFRPRPGRAKAVTPEFNTSGGGHNLAPDDVATIYDIKPLYQASYDGMGQKLVIAGQTDISLTDLRAFRSEFGLSTRDPQVVLAGADPGTSPGDLIEATLDLEWSGAVARNATIIYVNSNNVFTSVQYAINQNLAPVISLSYGACETGSPIGFRTVAQQAAAQGITWMTASGDQGAAACDYGGTVAVNGPAVSFPADIPEITAVGGTEFAETSSSAWAAQNGITFGSAVSYIAEKAWNDTATSGELSASGGGVSRAFSKPTWQTGPGVPADNQRDVPDVALSASGQHDGYLIYTGGRLMVVGGTSAASPSFAGIVTLLNHYLVAHGGKAGLGNLNPALYALAQSSTGAFHDITEGDNIVPCKAGSTGCVSGSFGYKAGPGYDLVTGLGSVDAYNLVTTWTSLPAGVGTTTALTASAAAIGVTGTTQLTATVAAVSGTTVPTGSVSFTAGTTVLGSAALTAAKTGATAVLAVKGSSLGTGANTITAAYTAAGSFRNSDGTTVLTVTAAAPVATTTTVTASPATLAASASASTVITVTVKAATGTAAPGGSVVLTAGNSTLGTAALTANGTVNFTVKGTALATGSNSITASYTATGNFGNSSGTVTVTVGQAAVATTMTLGASAVGISSTGSTVIVATVKAAGTASGSPAGTVTFFAGSTVLGTETLSAAGAEATASKTVAASWLAVGNNSITATYSGGTGFTGSSAAGLVVNVAAPAVATSTWVAVSAATVTTSATTLVTVTVKAASGKTNPTGSVSLADGNTSLGTATLTAAGTSTFSVKGSSLTAGVNTLTAVYAGASGFTGSKGTAAVTGGR